MKLLSLNISVLNALARLGWVTLQQVIHNMSAELPLTSSSYLSDDELVFYPREQITFDFNPLKDRPFVNLDYDESDNQSDPLAVSVASTVDLPMNTTSVGMPRTCMIYNPFSPLKSVEAKDSDVIVLSDDDLPPTVPLDLQNKPKKKKASNKPVNGRKTRKLRSQSRVIAAVVQAEENRKKKNPRKTPNNQSTAQKSAFTTGNSVTTIENSVTTTENSVTSTETSLVTTEELATSTENSSSLLVRELSQKMEERKRAINALRRTREAETALARKLVREIMRHDRPCHSSVGKNSCAELTSKQQRGAESASARKLIQELSKGHSFEQTIQSMQSTLSSNPGASNDSSIGTQGNSTCNPGTISKVNPTSHSKPQTDSGPRKRRNNQNECSCRQKTTWQLVPQGYSNASHSLDRGLNMVCRSRQLAEEGIHTPEQIVSVSNNGLFRDVQPSSPQAVSYSFPANNTHWTGNPMANVDASDRLIELAPERRFQMSSNDLFQDVHPNGLLSGRSLTNVGGYERTIEQATQITEQGSQVPDNASVESPAGKTHRRSMGAFLSSTIHPSHLVAPSDRSNATGGGGFIVPERNDRFVRVNPVGQSEPSCHRLAESVRLTTPEESSSLWNSEHRENPEVVTSRQCRVRSEPTSGVPNQVLSYATRADLDCSLDRLATIFQRRLAAVQILQRIRERERMVARPNGSSDTSPIIRSLLHGPSVGDNAAENPLLGQNVPQ